MKRIEKFEKNVLVRLLSEMTELHVEIQEMVAGFNLVNEDLNDDEAKVTLETTELHNLLTSNLDSANAELIRLIHRAQDIIDNVYTH